MTEQGTYRVDKCQMCGIPIALHSSNEGTIYATPLYIDARDRVVLAEELERAHSRALALQTEADKCRALLDGTAIEHSGQTLSERVKRLVERDREHFEWGLRCVGGRNVAIAERDSARKWAARWKRVAKLEHGASHSTLKMMR